MATTLHNRVEDYIGSRDPNMELTDWLTAMSEWLTASAREIFEVVPMSRLELIAPVPEVIPTTGLSMANKRVVQVLGNNRSCRKIPNGAVAQAKSSTSMHYATSTDPAFYVKGGSIYIVYSANEQVGTLHYIASPLVDYDQTAIANFPTEFESLVVVGAAVRARVKQLADKRKSLPDLLTDTELPVLDGVVVSIDLASKFSALAGYVTEEDIELVQAQVAEISAILNEMTVELGAAQQDKVHEYQRQLQKFTNNMQRVTTEIGAMQQELQVLQGQYQQELQLLMQGTKTP